MSNISITPFLWYDNNLDEAIEFYKGIFKDAKFEVLSRWQKGGMGREGSIMSASFELEGQKFMALNGGPMFKFTEAVSFFISCETQQELDWYWEKLTSGGGTPSRCGWLKDPFGLSWQVIPKALGQLLYSKDPETSKRVMDAMMKMDKIIIADLEAAAKQ